MTVQLEAIAVGTDLPEVVVAPINRTTLALFAGASNDHNPVHIDLDVARSAGLDDVFAQGMLSMALLARVLTEWVDQRQIRSYAVRFTAITPLYAGLACRGRVVSIDEVDGERIATVELTVTLADGTVTLRGQAAVAIPEEGSL